MFLSTVKDVSDSAYHRTLHTDSYYENVKELFEMATSKEQVIGTLKKIREMLLQGTFPY